MRRSMEEIPMTRRTAQQWFDAAWERAKTPHRSVDVYCNCRYAGRLRGPAKGEGCFIGVSLRRPVALQWDKVFRPVSSAVFSGKCGVSDISTLDKQSDFLCELQEIHDSVSPEDWEQALREFAAVHSLMIPD